MCWDILAKCREEPLRLYTPVVRTVRGLKKVCVSKGNFGRVRNTATHSFLDFWTAKRNSLRLIWMGQGWEFSQAISLPANQGKEGCGLEGDSYRIEVDGTSVPRLQGAPSEKYVGLLVSGPHVATLQGTCYH